MNPAIRRVGFGLMAMLMALIAQLTYVQIVRAKQLSRDPANFRVSERDYVRARGEILTIDGVVIAKSIPSNDVLKFRRIYPQGTLYAIATGFQSLLYGATGTERVYNDTLLGRKIPVELNHLDSILRRDNTQNVRLTIDSVAQTAARTALGNRRGSVVVLDTQTGGIVAMYSNPTYDPNRLSDHNDKRAKAAYTQLIGDPSNPMLNRTTRELYPPGSTFKVVTSAVAIDAGIVTPDTPFPFKRTLQLPLNGGTIRNFGGSSCGGTLSQGLRDSCNTTFGQLGLDLGERLALGGERFGLNGDGPPLDDSPRPVGSRGALPGTYKASQPEFARDAIGQAQTSVTPLEMALVAEAVATGGRMLVPHLLARVEDPNRVDPNSPMQAPTTWRTVMEPATAAELNTMMQAVVQSGTGTAARIPGMQVAGKTGTAQTRKGAAPHAWFIGFAPAQAPRYAIAVLVEHGGGQGDNATGGKVAAPIARDVLRAIFTKPQ